MNKIIEYGIYILFFILPLQTRYFLKTASLNGDFWEYGSFAIYGADILISFLLLFTGVHYLSHRTKHLREAQKVLTKPNTFFLGGILLLSYLFLSILWSEVPFISSFYTIRLIEIVVLIWLVSCAKVNKTFLFTAFIAGITVQACLGVYQFFNQYVGPSTFLGIAEQYPKTLGVAVVQTYLRRYLRAYGGMPHPNILGGWLVMGAFACFFLYQFITQRQDIKRIKRIFATSFILIIYAVIFFALILTFSRSAWLGFVVSWIVLIFFTFQKKGTVPRFVIVKFLIITGLLSIFAGLVLFEPLTERGAALVFSSNIGRLEKKSQEERIEGVHESIAIIKKSPVIGRGLGSYTELLRQSRPDSKPWEVQPVHVIPLIIWAEAGAIGLLLFAVFVIFLFTYWYRKNNIFGIIIIAALLPPFLFDHYLWTLYAGLMLIGASVSLAIRSA